MIRVAVIGSAGQLGTDLVRLLGRSGAYQVFPLGHSDLECTEPDSVRHALWSNDRASWMTTVVRFATKICRAAEPCI